MPQVSPHSQHFRRLVYSLGLSIGVSFGAILFGTSVMITSTAAGAEYSITLLSMAFSGSVLVGAAFAVQIGRHCDSHGVRGVIGLGGVLVCTGFLVFALSTAPWQLLVGWWVFIGPGSAMVLFDPAFIAIQQWFSREQRNRAAGVLTLITGLAGPIFIPAVTYANTSLGWRWTAVLLGVAVLGANLVTSVWALRAAPSGHTAAVAMQAPGPEHKSSWRGLPAGFLPLTICIAVTMAVLEAFNVHRIARFEDNGFDPIMLGWWAVAVGLLSLPGRYLLPVLANRYRSSTIWLALTALILPAVLLAVRGTESWELYGHFILFGLVFGAFMPLRAVLMSDWYSGPRFGAMMGFQAIAIAVGRAAGPAVVGWFADSSLGYSAGMILLAAALVLSAVAMNLATRAR